MARFRLSRLAKADLAQILETNELRWGPEGRRRYASLLAAAMHKTAADPQGPATREREDVLPGVRSFHVRYARRGAIEARVKKPAHILYYRIATPDVIEIVRVLDERMEPSRHLHT